ncbi:MAG: hypothetical protein ABW199_03615 [Caulobacterales bacterium]
MVVKVYACGICGTDLSDIRGSARISNGALPLGHAQVQVREPVERI